MTIDLQRIVIGVDFSPASADATRWAAQHFGHGTELILAHAVTLPEPPPIMRNRFGKRDLMVETLVEGATKRLHDLAASISAKSIAFDIREGDAARSLCDVAAERKADLLIVGARGERARNDRMPGTTAQHAVRDSTVPVLVVARPDERPISRILVPVDDEATARESLQWAALLSNRFNANVITLYVAGTGGGAGKSDRSVELAIESGVARDRVTGDEAVGVPAVEIISDSDRNSADILVMGRRSARNLRRAVLGSVTATVLGDPPCNVLVVPAA